MQNSLAVGWLVACSSVNPSSLRRIAARCSSRNIDKPLNSSGGASNGTGIRSSCALAFLVRIRPGSRHKRTKNGIGVSWGGEGAEESPRVDPRRMAVAERDLETPVADQLRSPRRDPREQDRKIALSPAPALGARARVAES